MQQETPVSWVPTREEGLRRLEAFLPHAGRDYGASRNEDRGPGDRSNVSTLSPYLRHRLVLEQEVIAAVLQRHGPKASEKFIQEVIWRTYWKGWLEMRPSVWTSYRDEVAAMLARLDSDPVLKTRVDDALGGRSGIVCLDAWVRELVETGYLHNHARMWFASLWIFTLRLPWQLGADFFLRHLLDGDPASNTLSWRWVAGMQTRGKHYLARASNIAKFSCGRFDPTEDFAESAEPIAGPPPPQPRPLPGRSDAPVGDVGLLITEEDAFPETWPLDQARVIAIASLAATDSRSPREVSQNVLVFADGALRDARSRAEARWSVPSASLDGSSGDEVVRWARSYGIQHLVTAYTPVGPVAAPLGKLSGALRDAGISLTRILRPWDEGLWPLATHGFFPFKERMPKAVGRILMGSPS